jgi:hypothetical protein
VILRDSNNREQAPNYQAGIPIGVFDQESGTGKPRIMIYNHYDITVLTHSTTDGHHRIVGFEVEPFSLAEDDHRDSNNPFTSSGPQYLKAGEEFRFSYRLIQRVTNFQKA